MTDETSRWPERLFAPGPKRILSIDGGGVRGALAVGVLRRIEEMLRQRYDRPDMVLADYFDLIGGTSTGAIVAGGLALGRDTASLEQLYRDMGPKIFRGGPVRVPLIQSRFDPGRLEKVLREVMGETATLGDAPWRTGFAAVAKRVDTGSAWVWTNCPRSKYWNGDPDDAGGRIVPNRDYSVAGIIHASAAAPFYFDLTPLEVARGEGGVFFDGGVTPHANPSLQLAMTALIPAYGLSWRAGAEELLIVSVGTGSPRPIKPQWRKKPRLLALWKALHALTSLSYDTTQQAIAVLQWLGTSPRPWPINSEIGGLEGAFPGPEPLWTFQRYDAPLEAAWLSEHLDRRPEPALLRRMARLDDDRVIPQLFEVGLAAGAAQVRSEHFPAAFDPPGPSAGS